MRIMTSDDIKQVSLEVLDDIHDFCIKNNIRYSLSGGTLIGAIRHGGYIPWDDDIDIYMPRPDYERFLKSYKSSNKFRLFAKSLSNSEMVYARVCEMEKTFVTSRLNFWTKEEKGVWIDIFPVDGAGDTYEEACKRVKVSRKLWTLTLKQRYSHIPFNILPSIPRKVLWIMRRIKCLGHDYIEEHDRLIREKDFDSSAYVADLAFMQYGIREIHKKEIFSRFMLHKFEGREYMITKDYDQFLRDTFGDYMQLPPENERVPRHSFNEFYWK